MPGKTSQRKGRAAEIELARILQGYGYDVQPGRAQSYGSTPDISGLPGIHIEVKRCEQLRPYDWLEQAQRDAVRFGDGLPAVFFRRNRFPWLVVMRLEDWVCLLPPPLHADMGKDVQHHMAHSKHNKA